MTTESEALKAEADPRDNLIASLYEQLHRANLRTIAATEHPNAE
jgi:hypothetical protein